MELKVDSCKNCPLYIFRDKIGGKNWWEFDSMCGHPKSTKEHIPRVYDEVEKGVIPKTPKYCPLQEDELILKK